MSNSDSDGPADRNDKKGKKRKLDAKGDDSSKDEAKSDKIDLGSKRFASRNEFRGRVFLDIREFYQDKDSGELKPGKKGISLSVGQWKILQENKDKIDKWLADD